MGEVKFTTTEVDHEILRNAARLAAVPVATWVRTTAIEAARGKMPKPEAAPKLPAKERKQLAMFDTTLGNLLTRIEAGDIPDVESWIARRRRDVGASKPDQAYTEAFAAWCREHGHTKGD